MLGQKGIIKWLSLFALNSIRKDKPDELLVTSICRVIFCELVAPLVGLKQRAADLFLMGMFSLIDAFLDQPLTSILPELPISQDIKHALLGKKSRLGDIYSLILLYEKGDWDNLQELLTKLNLDGKEVIKLYVNSLELTNQIFQSGSTQSRSAEEGTGTP